jgi:hypothetical protein
MPELSPAPTAPEAVRSPVLPGADPAVRAERARITALETLAELEPELRTAVGSAAQVGAIETFVVDAAAVRSARNAKLRRLSIYGYLPVWVLAICMIEMFLIPLAAWLWFGSQYRWWEYALVGIGASYIGFLIVSVMGGVSQLTLSRTWSTIRRLLVLLAAVATVVFVIRWHGGHPGGWEVTALGVGLLLIPAEIGVMQMRKDMTEARLDQLQELALQLVGLLKTVHRAAVDGTKPPEILVGMLESSAKRVLAASELAARGWPWSERQVRNQIRGFGGSVAAGLRWHKSLVVMPTADASATLFASFGRGLAAAVASDWQALMFEPAPSPAKSLWQRYRGRIALAAVLGAIIAATFLFPHLLPSAAESQIRALLALTAAFTLLSSPGEALSHAYDAFGNMWSTSAASKIS